MRTVMSVAACLAAMLIGGCRSGRVDAAQRGSGQAAVRPSHQRLPEPFATPSARNEPRVVARPPGAALRAPAGFRVSVFAGGLDRPRQIAVAPNGDVFVAESYANRVTVLRDSGGTGGAVVRRIFSADLDLPFGIAFTPGWLYVANTGSVVRFAYRPGQTRASGPPQVLARLPGHGYRQHWTRDLLFDASGRRLFVSVGSQGNVGEQEPRRAAILELRPDGQFVRIYASGLRNAVGLALQPGTGTLWCTCNERDGLGDNLPPDFVTSVRQGGFYGWPYYYIGPNHDPRMPERPALKGKVVQPDVLLDPHCAPLGIAFYTGAQLPAEYRGDAFVAEHGSWNRSARTGYKVVRVDFRGGRPAGVSDFVTGWLPSARSRSVWGRPVGVAVAKDGALLVSDDGGGVIWRVSRARQ